MKKYQGFSLIELLVTMAMLVILISVANQSYQHFFSQQALTASGERLYQFLRLAKSEAIKENKKIYVHFCQKPLTEQWSMALSEQSACDCFVQNSCLVNGIEKVMELTDGELVVASAGDVAFNGSQTSYSPMRFSVNTGSVTLSDRSGYKLKVIQGTVRLRICSLDGDQLGYKEC